MSPAAAAAIALLMLGLFAVVELLGVPVLSDESPDLGHAGVGAAAAGFALLVADVVLPVPSSGVMLANGALFGPVAGAALSLAGSEAAALVGYAIGRRGGVLLERTAAPVDSRRAAAAIERRGVAAVALTRPMPIVAETVTILAGAAKLPPARVALAAAGGSLPPAVVYALAGSLAVGGAESALVFGGAFLVAALLWLTQPTP
jgi:uncharacterized membrane protein YdjX (TVP38/TMEM64 family)